MNGLLPAPTLLPSSTLLPDAIVGPIFADPVKAVASFLRARTKTQGGKELGTFAPQSRWDDGTGGGTRPSREQVLDLINEYHPTHAAIFGEAIPAEYVDAVSRLESLGVALEVELTYWPEQVANGRSPYDQLKALFDSRMKALLSVLGLDGDGDGSPTPPGGGMPSYGGFPTTGIGMDQPL